MSLSLASLSQSELEREALWELEGDPGVKLGRISSMLEIEEARGTIDMDCYTTEKSMQEKAEEYSFKRGGSQAWRQVE
jgi:hypothetical protein